MNKSEPLRVEVTRGNNQIEHVESVHLIDAIISDADGKIVSVMGDAERLIFPRSAIKSLQALPLIESGAADAFGFTSKHLALACSSHNGEKMHTDTAHEMLERIDLPSTCLECGAQLPLRLADQAELVKQGKKASPIHNNCSGKHAGFLALAAHEKIEPENYIDISHPVQKMIAETLSQLLNARHGSDNYGIDGCSIPTYEVPLKNLAIAYAKFGVGADKDKARSDAMLRLRDACTSHPELVAGTNRFDTKIMTALGKRVLTKTGAEGVFTVSLPEPGLGIALKCRDGTTRAAETACAGLIASLLDLSDEEARAMQKLTNPALKNWNGFKVGHVRVARF